MANYELVTIKKGTIKTVDSFINTFNSIGANMKALSVSAYAFLTSEDKELKKDFQIRVMDELGMTKATLSYLKTAGWLYTLDDRFSNFAYTNVIYFKKAINYFTEKNEVDININTDILLTTMFKDLAKLHNSTLTEGYVEALASISQKELNNLINKYVSEEVEPEVVEEVEPEAIEEPTEETTEEFDENEELATFYNIIDDDFTKMVELALGVNEKTSKAEMFDRIKEIAGILLSYAQ